MDGSNNGEKESCRVCSRLGVKDGFDGNLPKKPTTDEEAGCERQRVAMRGKVKKRHGMPVKLFSLLFWQMCIFKSVFNCQYQVSERGMACP